jgi:hypothetical protein
MKIIKVMDPLSGIPRNKLKKILIVQLKLAKKRG